MVLQRLLVRAAQLPKRKYVFNRMTSNLKQVMYFQTSSQRLAGKQNGYLTFSPNRTRFFQRGSTLISTNGSRSKAKSESSEFLITLR